MTPDTFPDLFWSYTVVWLMLGLYIVSLGFRVRRLEKELTKGSKDCCGKEG